MGFFNAKAWENEPSQATPTGAAAWIDQEERLSAYTDARVDELTPVPLRRFTNAQLDGVTDLGPIINDALIALASAGGGKLQLPPSASLGMIGETIILQNKTGIIGSGPRATKLSLANGTNASMIEPFVSPDAIVTNAQSWSVAEIFLAGNKGGQTGTSHGIYHHINPSSTTKATNDEFFDPRFFIENVMIHFFLSDGFFGAGRSEGRLRNVTAQSCSGYGLRPGSDTWMDSCTAAGNGLAGIRISGNSIRCTNCKSYTSGQVDATGSNGAGWQIESAGGSGAIALVGCESQDNKGAGYLITGSQGVTLSACIADSNSTVSLASRPGFDLFSSTHCRLLGCISIEQRRDGTNSYQRHALRVRSGCTNNVIDVTHKAVGSGTVNADPYIQLDADCVSNKVTINGQGGQQTLTYAATVTPEVYAGETAQITLTGNVTFAAPTLKRMPGTRFTFIITQDGTGSRTVTWNAAFKLAGGAFTATTTAGKTDLIEFVWNGTNWIEVARSMNM